MRTSSIVPSPSGDTIHTGLQTKRTLFTQKWSDRGLFEGSVTLPELASQHVEPKTRSLDHFCFTFSCFHKKLPKKVRFLPFGPKSWILVQKSELFDNFVFGPEKILLGMLFVVNPLLLIVEPKIGLNYVFLNRQVEPLPQLINHESRTPALIAVNIAPCPRTNHSEILPGGAT